MLQPQRQRAVLLTLWLLVPVTTWAAATTPSLQQIRQIAGSGTPGLAVGLLDQQHPKMTQGADEWFRWSKARTDILVGWKQWALADQYLRKLPTALPAPLHRWALSQRAWLALERGDARLSRELLRKLIWHSGEYTAAESELWRRLIIRSYLMEQRIDDAGIAMLRYQQDHPSNRPQWLQLRAEILLYQQQPAAVLQWPADLQQALSPPLRMLVHLRARPDAAATIRRQAQALAEGEQDLGKAARARYWKIVAEASSEPEALRTGAIALENALLLAQYLPSSDKIFRLSSADWWQAYERYGTALANARQLLIGDDDAWFAAIAALDESAPTAAKALLVALANATTKAEHRTRALVSLAGILRDQHRQAAAQGQQTHRAIPLPVLLFLDRDRFPRTTAIPTEIRYQLLEYALAVSDIATASDLITTLPQQPEGMDAFGWSLQRSRVMVMGGRVEAGGEVLDTLLSEQLFLTPDQLDQFMQVLFDLQSGGHHSQALHLFTRLEKERQLPPKQRRELFYWIGESLSATRQYARAALYFMRSATYVDATGSDLWGQSARYSAAEALTNLGLVSDARRIYESLLEVTQDAARRSLLRGKLQKLLVLPISAGDVGE